MEYWISTVFRDYSNKSYIAAQVYFKDRALFSNTTYVNDLISITGDIHHIFPREYLKQSGVTDKARYNQVANYTYLDTQVNISIGKKSPAEYFKKVIQQCDDKKLVYGTISNINDLKENFRANCIPSGIENMNVSSYDGFLLERRKMMAKKIENYYKEL